MIDDDDCILDEDAAAAFLNWSPRSLQRGRVEGTGPEYVRIGKRRVGYRKGSLKAYAAGRTHKSRAAELAAA